MRYVLNDLIDKPFKLQECRLASCKDKLLEVLRSLGDMQSLIPTFEGSSLSLAVKAADFVTQLLMGTGGRILHILTTSKPYQAPTADLSNSRTVLHPQFKSCQQLSTRCTHHSIGYAMFLITEQPSVRLLTDVGSTHAF